MDINNGYIDNISNNCGKYKKNNIDNSDENNSEGINKNLKLSDLILKRLSQPSEILQKEIDNYLHHFVNTDLGENPKMLISTKSKNNQTNNRNNNDDNDNGIDIDYIDDKSYSNYNNNVSNNNDCSSNYYDNNSDDNDRNNNNNDNNNNNYNNNNNNNSNNENKSISKSKNNIELRIINVINRLLRVNPKERISSKEAYKLLSDIQYDDNYNNGTDDHSNNNDNNNNNESDDDDNDNNDNNATSDDDNDKKNSISNNNKA